jgi:hypothetical protein
MLPLSSHSVNTYLTDNYPHPAQEDAVQPPQPEPLLEALPLEDLPMPKRDRSLFVFFDPHFSHATSGFVPNTSFSKSAPQALQWYS